MNGSTHKRKEDKAIALQRLLAIIVAFISVVGIILKILFL